MKPIVINNYKSDLERRYAARLDILKADGEIVDWLYEPIKINIGVKVSKSGKRSSIFYTPDFFIIYIDRFEFHETKGYWRTADKVRIRAAAKVIPWIKFVEIMKNSKNNFVATEI